MITSTANPRVKKLVNLIKKRKLRDSEQVFVAEGMRMFREVPPERIEEVWVSQSFYRKEQECIGRVLKGTGITPELLTDTVYERISDTKTPQGILTVARQTPYTLQEVTGGECPLLLVLDHIQDPGNLGTIVRTAEGAGVTGIIMSRDCVDLYQPKTIRATMGSVYRMHCCYAQDILPVLFELKKKHIRLYAAHLKGKQSYDKEAYGIPCAFLIGNEGNGLRMEVAEQADAYVRIPMLGQVESLNAAIAASVLMFEAARQRRNSLISDGKYSKI